MVIRIVVSWVNICTPGRWVVRLVKIYRGVFFLGIVNIEGGVLDQRVLNLYLQMELLENI